MKALHMIAFILLVVGGLNWGLDALGYNVVDMVLGAGSTAGKVAYLLVGLSAVYIAVTHKGDCKTCGAGSMA
ncbi:MAG: DUF378 domain-containing protein [Candidatus Yonathbacteria bacterium]|nr:DUF378 domain-containing protein [Candidatus Yonathbacteria bacterium]